MICGKFGHYDDDEIPANGLVQVSDIDGNGRIYGEIAYYRNWAENGIKPSVLLKEDLNTVYDGDLNYVPRGVEDLYYLDNEGIGIKGDKKYIIDATNSMIYSINGYGLNGVDVHSLAMYKAIENGIDTAPKFATAEVRGSGDNIIYAGSQYLMDKNGNYVDENGNTVGEANKIENPYGFQIIASPSSSNIYKLYNNGNLYAKGVKGTQIQTNTEEMTTLDSTKWTELNIPSNIGSYKKIIRGSNTFYAIDSSDHLWAWGKNSDFNKLGLSEEQKRNYVEREAVQIDVDGKLVEKVFDLEQAVYVLTKDGLLYVSGGGDSRYNFGFGAGVTVDTFTEVELSVGGDKSSASGLKDILMPAEGFFVLLCFENQTYWAIGPSSGYLNRYWGKWWNFIFKICSDMEWFFIQLG